MFYLCDPCRCVKLPSRSIRIEIGHTLWSFEVNFHLISCTVHPGNSWAPPNQVVGSPWPKNGSMGGGFPYPGAASGPVMPGMYEGMPDVSYLLSRFRVSLLKIPVTHTLYSLDSSRRSNLCLCSRLTECRLRRGITEVRGLVRPFQVATGSSTRWCLPWPLMQTSWWVR